MSALKKNVGVAPAMDRHIARQALIDLGLVHAALEMKTEMSPDEMKDKLRLGAQAVVWMFDRAEGIGEACAMRASIRRSKARREKGGPRVKRKVLTGV